MPKVYNKHHKNVPKDAVYVGRPTKWGNPYIIGVDGDRDEVVKKYGRKLLHMQLHSPDIFVDYVHPLIGKDLVCFCAPKPCHADYLLRAAVSFVDLAGTETIVCSSSCESCKEMGIRFNKDAMDYIRINDNE